VDKAFVEFGLDSFLGVEMTIAINKKYGTELSNIKLFDHPTVREFSLFLEQEIKKLPGYFIQPPAAPVVVASVQIVSSCPILPKRGRAGRGATRNRAQSDDKIAIVGMSGRYPQADNLEKYWDNLVESRNCIVEVPRSRWDIDRYYDPDPATKGKTNSKWLGALDDIDCFDPLFFRISPQEAEYMDPQHRLFLQESYRAFEDAGYSGNMLSNNKCGVYLGISTNDYEFRLVQSGSLPPSVTSNSHAIAAARIAYYLNLKGPAISVDTACSSSLVAVHLACQGLLSHETDMALAGGVCLWLIPESYLAMSQAGMLSSSGQCKTFDDTADGIVVGEGVGALVLKRLKDAQEDNDFIYGVILGSGINQDGKTNGITAPSVNSQIELERAIYAKYKIDPETISYVETHGTGTKLGDPIELEALATVFKEKTTKKNFCALGSVKSNIGHTSSAAGVAGLQKVLLSMRHRTLVPSLNVKKESSHFDFENSPFYISRKNHAWNVAPGSLRRAAVSSFGFSGTNAHLVIEQYSAEQIAPPQENINVLVLLSARTPEQLRQKAFDLLVFIGMQQERNHSGEQSAGSSTPLDLSAVAYTLQIGREVMEERLGFIVNSIHQLAEKLSAFVDGEKNIDDVYQGRVEPGNVGVTLIGRDDDMQEAIDKWMARKKFSKLLDLWIRGLNVDWSKLYGAVKPRRISLPTYPFAREHYWIDETPVNRDPDSNFELDGNMKSIEDIINQIDDNTMEAEQAVEVLKMLV
jgi:acyl transferase domain-containing protein